VEEIKNRVKKGKSVKGWEEERVNFMEERGWKMEEIEGMWTAGEFRGEVLFEREKELQRMESWEKIVNSKYNKWYKYVKSEGVPGYLKKGWGESRWKRVARFRLGSNVKGRKYWEGEEKRKCRLCEREEETWEHIWEECCRCGEGGV